MNNINIVFIGGVGRSGTSITRKMLGLTPTALTFPFEYRFIIDPDGIIDFINFNKTSWSPFLYDKKLKRLETFLLSLSKQNIIKQIIGDVVRSSKTLKGIITVFPYHGWNLEKEFPLYRRHVKKLINNLYQFSYQGSWVGSDVFKLNNKIYYASKPSQEELYAIFQEFLANLFKDLLFSKGKEFLIEDNTWNLLFVEELTRLFPSAKFMHIYRDPRDIVSSFVEQRWMPKDVKQSAIICRDLYNRISDNISKSNNDIILEISIEEIANEKEKSLQTIFSFLKIEPPKEINDFKLSNSSFGRWEQDLNQREIEEITPILKEVLAKYQYI